MNKTWLVLLAPLAVAGGGVATASTGGAPTPPPEEVELARAQFEAALTANGIDLATVHLVMCDSEYGVATDGAQGLVRSMCFGVVGEYGNPNGPQPVWYNTHTVHLEDGTLITRLGEIGVGAITTVGEPTTAEPTPPFSVPG